MSSEWKRDKGLWEGVKNVAGPDTFVIAERIRVEARRAAQKRAKAARKNGSPVIIEAPPAASVTDIQDAVVPDSLPNIMKVTALDPAEAWRITQRIDKKEVGNPIFWVGREDQMEIYRKYRRADTEQGIAPASEITSEK
jgi:hypothetical protein